MKLQIMLARWCLRFGLAFVYGYAAIEILFHPDNFLKYVPMAMQNMIPISTFLVVFCVFEALLTVWLLTGKHDIYAGSLSFLVMCAIIIPNVAFMSVLFRNIAIAFASLALMALDYER